MFILHDCSGTWSIFKHEEIRWEMFARSMRQSHRDALHLNLWRIFSGEMWRVHIWQFRGENIFRGYLIIKSEWWKQNVDEIRCEVVKYLCIKDISSCRLNGIKFARLRRHELTEVSLTNNLLWLLLNQIWAHRSRKSYFHFEFEKIIKSSG